MQTNIKNISKVGILFAALLLPLFARAQTTQAPVSYPSPVTNCQRSGALALSDQIGRSTSSGGPFVPVADFTVELNTATLVYKECVLNEAVVQERKAATALIVRDIVNKFRYQQNGSPGWPVNLDRDVLKRQDEAVARTLKNQTFDPLNDDFENLVKNAVAYKWRLDTRASNNALACPQQDLPIYQQASDFSFEGMLSAFNPACNPVFAYYRAQEVLQDEVDRDTAEMMFRLNNSNGIYGKEEVDANGNRITTEPGIFVKESVTQAVQLPLKMLSEADEPNEIIDPLFASMSDQLMTQSNGGFGTSGFAGLTGGTIDINGGTVNTGSNYLNQMLQNQLSGGGFSGGGGSNLQGLQALLRQELEYQNVVTQIGQLLTKTTNDLNAASTKCWSDVAHANAALGQFSQRVVDTAKNIQDSQSATQGLQALITSLTSTNPPTTTQIQQTLGTLKIHSQQQYDQVVQDYASWSQSMPQFVQTTVDQWLSTNQTNVGCSL